MLYLKQVVETVTTETVITKQELTPQYYWSSRSVYAVEFRANQFNTGDEDKDWFDIIFTEVQFENKIIRSQRFPFSKEHPLTNSGAINRYPWVKELFHAFTNEGYFDSRTKEQFEKDFDAVIHNLKNIRE